MTKEQKDKILKAIAEDRNDYARDRDRRIAEEQGKIIGADYMLQRFLDILKTEVESQDGSDKKSNESLTLVDINGNKHTLNIQPIEEK